MIDTESNAADRSSRRSKATCLLAIWILFPGSVSVSLSRGLLALSGSKVKEDSKGINQLRAFTERTLICVNASKPVAIAAVN